MKTMKKTREYVHIYAGNGREVVGLCGVRIYEADEGQGPSRLPVVVCSEPPAAWGYEGPSVTNEVERIAAGILADLLPDRIASGLKDPHEAPFVFVEHVPRAPEETRAGLEETYDLVKFASYEVRTTGGWGSAREALGEPDWDHLGAAEAGRVCAEHLYGAPPREPDYLARLEAAVKARLPQRGALPEDDADGDPAQEPRPRRAEGEHGMLPPLYWDHETGDVVIERVADFAAGLNSGDQLAHRVRTNVPWSAIEHSPTGFEWGYGGSGPADLALSILNLFEPPGTDGQEPVRCWDGYCSRTAQVLHQEFKAAFLSGMPWEGGRIPGGEIRAWISERVVRVGGKVVGYVPRGEKAG